jgi:DNA-binding transcriptional ArsR family regulator
MTPTNLAKVCKALSDTTRLDIISLLAGRQAMVSSLIAASIGVKTNLVSHHLRILANEGIVQGQKNGQYVLYCLNRKRTNEFFSSMKELLQIGDTDDTNAG